MPSATAPAAATGLPNYDPNHIDLGLIHLTTMMDLMVSALGDIDRSSQQNSEQLLRLDALAWVAREHAQRLSEQFAAGFPHFSHPHH